MKLGVYGSGGLGREIYEIALRRNILSSIWSEIVFIDDFIEQGDFFGTKRISNNSLENHKNEYECVIAIGEPSVREKIYNRAMAAGIKMTRLIDPTALISPTARIGEGTIVCEFSTVHTGVEIGYNCLIQPFCNIGHDIRVGNNTILSPFCAPGGGSVFGDRVYVGMHSSIIELIKIGDDAIVGMGSAVFRDVPAGATVVGNPARVTRGNDEHKVFSPR